MYAYGDDREPLDETVKVFDEIVTEYASSSEPFQHEQSLHRSFHPDTAPLAP